MPINKDILERLRNDPSLKELDLSFEHLTVECIKLLCQALVGNTTLQKLSQGRYSPNVEGGGYDFDAEGMKLLAKALSKNTTLQTLSLCLGAEGVKPLAEALSKNITLRTLSLGGYDLGAEGMKPLAEALSKNTTLQTFNLRYDFMNAEGVKSLAEALSKNTTLQTLDLFSSHLGVEGMEPLAEALSKNTALQTLSLRNDFINAEEMKLLAKALSKNTTLQTFNLRRLDAEGMKLLAEALSKNTTLRALGLEGNRLGVEGMKPLAEALLRNSALQTLNLTATSLDDEEVKILAGALARNKGLQALDLSSDMQVTGTNNFDRAGAKALMEALVQNTTLQTLDYNFYYSGDGTSNEIEEEERKYKVQIKKYLERNKKLAEERKNSVSNNNNNARPQATVSTKAAQKQPATTLDNNSNPYSNNNNMSHHSNSHNNNNNALTLSEQFALFGNAQTVANLQFLNRLSVETKQYLEDLKPEDRQEIHTKVNELVKQQAELHRSLDPVIRAQQADAQLQQAIQKINQNPETKFYFETLLRMMDETLLASLVIGSGKVAQSRDLPSRLFDGATQIASVFFPPAAIFLGFSNQVLSTANDIGSFRDTRKLAQWVRVSSDIPTLSLALAVACAQSQENIIKANQPINAAAQPLLTRLKYKCQSLFEQFKAGERFKIAQERAILDAYVLLDYMIEKTPKSTIQEAKIKELVEHLTGKPMVQTPASNTTAPTSSAVDLNTIMAEMRELRLKQERADTQSQANLKLLQEQADETRRLKDELATQKAKTRELEKQQSEHNQRNELVGNPRDKPQDGPQIQVDEDELIHPDLPKNMTSSRVLAFVYKQTQSHEERINVLSDATTAIQDNVQQLDNSQDNLYKQQEREKRESERRAIEMQTAANLRLAEFQAAEYGKNKAKK